jgi:ribonuclease Y
MSIVYVYGLCFVGAILLGFLAFRILLVFLPKIEARTLEKQKKELVTEAYNQKPEIKANLITKENDKLALLQEEALSSLATEKEELEFEEEEQRIREEVIEAEERRVEKLQNSLNARMEQIEVSRKNYEHLNLSLEQMHEKRTESLAQKTKLNPKVLLTSEVEHIVGDRVIEAQKSNKSWLREYEVEVSRLAQRVLYKSQGRYAPEFVWPKASNNVDFSHKRQLGAFEAKPELLVNLEEISGVKVSLLEPQRENESGGIKLAGGFGIYREACRLALDKALTSGDLHEKRIFRLYNSIKSELEQEAKLLGKKAVEILQLENVHIELQLLIGALNWRTSYRQNQWHHTVEVATLAGIMASELGVDVDQAKRVGLLHDIGKAIDYRIEGSHAVISGDYSDRFGEKKVISDTVMSHHSDLVVETPLAYILRAADTLSGARPGARVNLEEGYQVRLSAIYEVINSFKGICDVSIMHGGREVHVLVDETKISDQALQILAKEISKKIEQEVSYPGQIKILLNRTFESVSVA